MAAGVHAVVHAPQALSYDVLEGARALNPFSPFFAGTLTAAFPPSQPHYTVVNRWNDTLGEQNMIAVSIPTLLDSSLAPPGHHIIHAYAAGESEAILGTRMCM